MSCPVCQSEAMVDPVAVGPCGHQACLVCALELRRRGWQCTRPLPIAPTMDGRALQPAREWLVEGGKCPLCRGALLGWKTDFAPQTPPNAPSQCHLCGATTTGDLQAHLRACTENMPQCPVCDRRLAPHAQPPESFYLHLHTDCGGLSCSQCNRTGNYMAITACERRHVAIAQAEIAVQQVWAAFTQPGIDPATHAQCLPLILTLGDVVHRLSLASGDFHAVQEVAGVMADLRRYLQQAHIGFEAVPDVAAAWRAQRRQRA